MPRSSDKKRPARGKEKAPPEATQEPAPEPAPGLDLPDPESIIEERSFTSPKGRTYRILVTDELDAYEEPEPPPEPKPKRSRKKRRE